MAEYYNKMELLESAERIASSYFLSFPKNACFPMLCLLYQRAFVNHLLG
jgi:hypothetical protein